MLLPLRDGYKIPQLGLGTWLSKPHEVENAVNIYTLYLIHTQY